MDIYNIGVRVWVENTGSPGNRRTSQTGRRWGSPDSRVSQPARWWGVLPGSRNSVSKDIGVLKAARDLAWTAIPGERGQYKIGSAEAGGWRMVWPWKPWLSPSWCWKSLSILSRGVWWSNLLTQSILSLIHFWLSAGTQFWHWGYKGECINQGPCPECGVNEAEATH